MLATPQQLNNMHDCISFCAERAPYICLENICTGAFSRMAITAALSCTFEHNMPQCDAQTPLVLAIACLCTPLHVRTGCNFNSASQPGSVRSRASNWWRQCAIASLSPLRWCATIATRNISVQILTIALFPVWSPCMHCRSFREDTQICWQKWHMHTHMFRVQMSSKKHTRCGNSSNTSERSQMVPLTGSQYHADACGTLETTPLCLDD